MRLFGALFGLLGIVLPGLGATFGDVVSILGGASDIVLDEPRNRVYLVNPSQNRVEVYQTNFRPPRVLIPNGIRTDSQPVSAAMSRDGRYLYVTCYNASSLNVIDLSLSTPAVVQSKRVTLPASPEGVAVGGDGRVLVSTIGTGQGRSTLVIHDPQAPTNNNVTEVVYAPPPPASPLLPAPSGRIFLGYRGHMETTRDGRYIVGVNGTGNTRIVFVYEVVSGTVLRSRSVTNISGVLAIAPDSSKFMAGASLFDFASLAVLAQQNAANAPFSFPAGSNFNLQQNQGGSVFSPDGSVLYSGFNIAPVQNPPARANVTRLLLNDPDNLLIKLGLQLPENLSGKMVITADGTRIYALSESGFVMLPVSTINQSPLAMPDSPVILLARDQCGVTGGQQSANIKVQNVGGGTRMSVSVQLLMQTPTGVQGLGSTTGPGGGGVGGGVIIVLPPVVSGPTRPGAGAGATGGFGTNTQAAIAQTAPLMKVDPREPGVLNFSFNPTAARALGTISPHDFLVQSNEAINIPPNVRVYQNSRDADSRGNVLPVAITSSSEGLTDMLIDNVRQRLYISNAGLNRIEVFDIRQQVFLAPIKVGQLPHGMAFGMDNTTLYVANTGGESISMVDLDKGQMVGRVKFPPLPFNAGFSLITPSAIAGSQRGPQILMSDGTFWKVVGDQATPRPLNPAVFGNNARTINGGNPVVRNLASTPDGRFVILMAGTGFAYLYSSDADDFIVGRQVLSTPLTGYIGPLAAGPGGRYYLVNGTILNDSLTPIGSAPAVPVPGQVTGGFLPNPTATTATAVRPVSAVAAVGNSNFVRFSQPIRANQNTQITDAGIIELVDVTSGGTQMSVNALEGPLSTVTGNARVPVNARTMVVDAAGTTIYMLTTSGLSIIPLARVNPADRPVVNRNGVVNLASSLTNVASGSLISVSGRSLAYNDSAPDPPLPTVMGGACVTLNNTPLPLLMTSGEQINAQLPPNLAAGRYSLIVRSIERQIPSAATQITVAKYAPAVFMVEPGQPLIQHADGTLVNKEHKARRDEVLYMRATGLGPTKGGAVTAGAAAPSSPLAVTDPVQVFFGNPGYKEAGIIVEWSGLEPGRVGIYLLRLRVPGAHIKGDAVPVTIRIGGVNSPTTGPAVPYVAVE